jgi:hypothetical protein
MFEPASAPAVAPGNSLPAASAASLAARDRRREKLEEEIAKLQADINAANARLVGLVEEHARQEDWRVHDGIRSEGSFLSWRLGLTPPAASGLVEVTEGLRQLPRIRAAFRAGRLSVDQVRALVQVATPEDEPELLRLALGMSGSQLARFCSYYRRILRIEDGRYRARFLRTSYTSDGMWRISGRLPAEEGAVVDQAINAAVARLRVEDELEAGQEGDAAEASEDPFGAERADALVRLASSFLQGDGDTGRPDDRYTVVVHADAAALESGRGEARIEGAGEIPPEAASRIACEAPVVALLEKDGRPLSVGRKTRRVSVGLRRALEARDRQCCFPGCARQGRLQAHHIRHWKHGGETSPENLLLLCRSHHIATHEGGLSVERTLDGFLFRRPDGVVIQRPRLRAGGPGIGHHNRSQGIEVTPDTCAPEWGGEPGSILYVAEVFAARSPPTSAAS